MGRWRRGFLLAIPAASAHAQDLRCDVGALPRDVGGAEWLVHGCRDARSLVVTTPASNPAAPFFFFLIGDDGYRITGEGTGDRQWTRVAFDELAAMSPRQIAQRATAVRATAHDGSNPPPR